MMPFGVVIYVVVSRQQTANQRGAQPCTSRASSADGNAGRGLQHRRYAWRTDLFAAEPKGRHRNLSCRDPLVSTTI